VLEYADKMLRSDALRYRRTTKCCCTASGLQRPARWLVAAMLQCADEMLPGGKLRWAQKP
jgi:hypothetical protein